jgi:RNA polymerase sigma factor (sigma-70 family)
MMETENKAMDPDKAFAKELYNQYGVLIYRTCLKILGSQDDAKDALQAVFLKLLEQYAEIRDKEKVVPWIFSAAKNHCFNHLRYQKKFKGSVDADMTAHEGGGTDGQAVSREVMQLVFREHSKKVRDAVYFTYAESFDQREIQKMTGQSPATIRRNLKRFNDSLPAIRKRLELS